MQLSFVLMLLNFEMYFACHANWNSCARIELISKFSLFNLNDHDS